MKEDAKKIIETAIRESMPDNGVYQALDQIPFLPAGRLVVIALGKAAWEMGQAASRRLNERIDLGVVITKYDHLKGPIHKMELYEAGHPVPDENSYIATKRALELADGLTAKDTVLFLLSGGGSALFEYPLVPSEEMADITMQLLSCGADIVEINTIRKRLSAVKGGRFALRCAPAKVYTIVLSDIIGDPLDMIASGPAYPDTSTYQDALRICDQYHLRLSDQARAMLREETPKQLENVTTFIIGSVKKLCAAAAETARQLGYEPILLTTSLSCEAREAGAFLAAIAREHQHDGRSYAYLAGGETVVHLTGKGKGGRSQELALAAAEGIGSCCDTCIFSFGSDGTDGPTDAAGGIVDETTAARIKEKGISIRAALADNDSYHALKSVDALITTGPTGTNVNDLAVLLIRRHPASGEEK